MVLQMFKFNILQRTFLVTKTIKLFIKASFRREQ